jgi:hypothetical protein
MTVLETLTPEQEAQIPVYKDKFLAYGLQVQSNVPKYTDQEVLSLFTDVYAVVGLKAPTKWMRDLGFNFE